MNAPRVPAALALMRVRRAGRPNLECITDHTLSGIEECDECQLEFDNVEGRVYVDDVELARSHDGRYGWRPSFMAGRVGVLVLSTVGQEHWFYLQVAPASSKTDVSSFERMMAEIRSHSSALLIGDSSARDRFGKGADRVMDDMVRMSRLAAYGPPFVRALRALGANARPVITQTTECIPLVRARRISAAALRAPRLAAVITGRVGVEAAANLAVSAQVIASTLDTPAHRALKAVAIRILHAAEELADRVNRGALSGPEDEHSVRRDRRLYVLNELVRELKTVLKAHPIAAVSRAEVTAAALTQIAASPPYAQAYRLGAKALSLGVGEAIDDQLTIKPTWGVYETWCFVELWRRVSERFGPWRRCKGPLCADESWALELGGQRTLELHFQAKFTARSDGGPAAAAWSVSRQRIPDIVLVLISPDGTRFAILDAKYRRHRSNVLEAMESAHLYRDSLRIGRNRPDFCYLLLPAEADVAHLNQDDCHAEHQIGTVCEFAPGLEGVKRCAAIIERWLLKHGEGEAR